MTSRLRRVIAGTCEVGFVGILAAAWHYRRTINNVQTDDEATVHSLQTFSTCTARGSETLYDVAIVGGGIVGVATAREIRARYPDKKVLLLEMESDVAQHQSGHNSGCIHAGMYYPPGSAMARLCPRGHALMIDYCTKNKLPMELCGKMVVATRASEVPAVEKLYENGRANGVPELQLLRSEEEIQAKEPLVRGVAALWSPRTGIVDYAEVTRHMLRELCQGSGGGDSSSSSKKTNNNKNKKAGQFTPVFQFQAMDFVGVQAPGKASGAAGEELVLIRGRERGQYGPERSYVARHVITCCGLGNDDIAKHSGNVLTRVGQRIVQTYGFRGLYYELVPEKRDLVRMHVYPAPSAKSTGIDVGVHLTPTVNARRGRQLIIGPGSALAFDRYGYTPYQVDLEYMFNCAFSKGGWMSLLSNAGMFAKTYYIDLSKAGFLAEARKLVPSIQSKDVVPSFSGVMGVGVTDAGKLCSDFAIEFARPRVTLPAQVTQQTDASRYKSNPSNTVNIQNRVQLHMTSNKKDAVVDTKRPLLLNVRNAPSPAATASLAIAEDIVRNAEERFAWK